MLDMTRRAFLGSAAILAGTASVAGAGSSYLFNTPESVIIRIVRRHFPETRIPDDLLRRFAREYIANEPSANRVEFQLLRPMAPLFVDGDLDRLLPEQRRRDLEIFQRLVVTRFIQSTDFLEQYRQGNNAVTTMQFWRALDTACVNPLAEWA